MVPLFQRGNFNGSPFEKGANLLVGAGFIPARLSYKMHAFGRA